LSSQFIIQYHDTILNPTLFLLDVVGQWTDKSFNIEYCSHHPNSRGKYMQCPGLHNTGPIHMWLLFCCVCTTPSWKWSSLEYEGFSDSTRHPLWPATQQGCWCGDILSGKVGYIECWETRTCESVLCSYLTFWTNRQFWLFQLFRIKEPSVLIF
jgi:hypothetical protein